jgi:hypothetical protein
MIRIVVLLARLPALLAAGLAADNSLGFSLIESLGAMFLIIGFAVVAAGWTIRHDV